MNSVKKHIGGIILCGVIAFISTFLSKISIGEFSFELIGAPVFSIIFGMIITLFMPSIKDNKMFSSGIKLTSKKILQLAVIVLGFTLNLTTIASVGAKSLPVIICTISTSLIMAFLLMKLLKINSKTACLIGVGSSICGGSAIAATAPVIDADETDVAQSISVIFLFNVLAALIFPSLGQFLGLGTEGFAVFAGTAVNDTSSVTATASTAENIYNVSGILSYAVTVKLTRTLAIIPITLSLAFYKMKKSKCQSEVKSKFSFKSVFPWFILYFISASIITTVAGIIPNESFTSLYNDYFVTATKYVAKFFISMAMVAVGLNTNIVQLIKNSKKPIILGFCCWCGITVVSLLVQKCTGLYYLNL